jgi:hypothetical protein
MTTTSLAARIMTFFFSVGSRRRPGGLNVPQGRGLSSPRWACWRRGHSVFRMWPFIARGRLREIAAPCLKLLKLLTPKHCRRRNSRSTLVERGADALHGGIGSFVLRDRVKRLGVLWGLAENDNVYELYLSAFKQRLHDLGWIDGRNVRLSTGSRVGSLRRHASCRNA